MQDAIAQFEELIAQSPPASEPAIAPTNLAAVTTEAFESVSSQHR